MNAPAPAACLLTDSPGGPPLPFVRLAEFVAQRPMRGAEWLIAQSPDLNMRIEAIVVGATWLSLGAGRPFEFRRGE